MTIFCCFTPPRIVSFLMLWNGLFQDTIQKFRLMEIGCIRHVCEMVNYFSLNIFHFHQTYSRLWCSPCKPTYIYCLNLFRLTSMGNIVRISHKVLSSCMLNIAQNIQKRFLVSKQIFHNGDKINVDEYLVILIYTMFVHDQPAPWNFHLPMRSSVVAPAILLSCVNVYLSLVVYMLLYKYV